MNHAMDAPCYEFRLYVAGDAENSRLAAENLHALCAERLPQRHRIEVVDVLQDPKRAFADGIFMTPTLIKLAPAPQRKIIGSLSERKVVLLTLGLEAGH